MRGQVLLTNQLGSADTDGALDERELNARYARRLAELIDDESFPGVSAALLSGSLEDEGDFGGEEFRFGLNTVLDGIEALVTRRATGRRR